MKEQSNKKKIYLILANVLLSLLLVMTTAITITLAIKQFNMGIGGNITFQANDVQATISKGVISNGTLTDDANKMQSITLTPETTDETGLVTAKESWKNLVITFDGISDVTLSFSITNNHTEKGLEVSFETTPGTQSNMEMSATIDGESKTSITIPAKSSMEIDTTIDCVIKFHITDTTKSASIKGFNFTCNLSLDETQA